MQELQINRVIRSRKVNFRFGRILAMALVGSLALAGVVLARNQSVVTITNATQSACGCNTGHSGGHGGGSGGGGTIHTGN